MRPCELLVKGDTSLGLCSPSDAIVCVQMCTVVHMRAFGVREVGVPHQGHMSLTPNGKMTHEVLQTNEVRHIVVHQYIFSVVEGSTM